MKRILIVTGVVVSSIVLLVVGTFLSAPEKRALDLAMPIRMPDGGLEPLSEVVAAARRQVAERESAAIGASATTEESKDESSASSGPARERAEDDLLFRLGRQAFDEGRVDEAIALLRSVSPDSPRYSRAQRFVGWDILAEEQSRPHEGLAYVTEALWTSPLEGNCWQDAGRVYGRVLGLPLK